MMLVTFAGPRDATAKTPMWPAIGRFTAGRPAPYDVALIVAIEDYAYVGDVPGATRNARAWYRYFTERRWMGSDRVTMLLDKDARDVRIRKAAARAARAATSGGTLWFVFIGHGAAARDGRTGVLIGADADQDPEMLYGRSVGQDEIARTLQSGRAGQVVMILDSCFSGKTRGGAPLVRGLQPLIALRRAAPAARLTVLSAGRSDQFAGPLPGEDRPAFSYLLLGALRGWGDRNGDGRVTAGEANDYATRALASLPIRRSQRPQLITNSPSLVLADRARETAPDLVAIVQGRPQPVVAACPGGTRWNGKVCVGAVACPAGTRWNGRACEAPADRPAVRIPPPSAAVPAPRPTQPAFKPPSASAGASGLSRSKRATIARTVSFERASIRRCYTIARRRGPAAPARFTVLYTLDKAGRIVATSAPGLEPRYAMCVNSAFQRIRGLPAVGRRVELGRKYDFTAEGEAADELRRGEGPAPETEDDGPELVVNDCGSARDCYAAGNKWKGRKPSHARALWKRALEMSYMPAAYQLGLDAYRRKDRSACIAYADTYLKRNATNSMAKTLQSVLATCRRW